MCVFVYNINVCVLVVKCIFVSHSRRWWRLHRKARPATSPLALQINAEKRFSTVLIHIIPGHAEAIVLHHISFLDIDKMIGLSFGSEYRALSAVHVDVKINRMLFNRVFVAFYDSPFVRLRPFLCLSCYLIISVRQFLVDVYVVRVLERHALLPRAYKRLPLQCCRSHIQSADTILVLYACYV